MVASAPYPVFNSVVASLLVGKFTAGFIVTIQRFCALTVEDTKKNNGNEYELKTSIFHNQLFNKTSGACRLVH